MFGSFMKSKKKATMKFFVSIISKKYFKWCLLIAILPNCQFYVTNTSKGAIFRKLISVCIFILWFHNTNDCLDPPSKLYPPNVCTVCTQCIPVSR